MRSSLVLRGVTALRSELRTSFILQPCRILSGPPTLKGPSSLLEHSSGCRSISISNVLFKKHKEVEGVDLTPDSEVIFVDAKNKETRMKYAEVLEKVGNRRLVQVLKTKKKEEIPHFKVMSDVDLEVALRKQRNETGYKGSKEIIQTAEGRIKQKTLDVSAKISDHDLRFQLEKVKKWLKKGDFVRINIKSDKSGDGSILEKKIHEEFSDQPSLLGTSNARLRIKVH